jgi:hypothetical protein
VKSRLYAAPTCGYGCLLKAAGSATLGTIERAWARTAPCGNEGKSTAPCVSHRVSLVGKSEGRFWPAVTDGARRAQRPSKLSSRSRLQTYTGPPQSQAHASDRPRVAGPGGPGRRSDARSGTRAPGPPGSPPPPLRVCSVASRSASRRAGGVARTGPPGGLPGTTGCTGPAAPARSRRGPRAAVRTGHQARLARETRALHRPPGGPAPPRDFLAGTQVALALPLPPRRCRRYC